MSLDLCVSYVNYSTTLTKAMCENGAQNISENVVRVGILIYLIK